MPRFTISSKILSLTIGLAVLAAMLSSAVSVVYTRGLINSYDATVKEELNQKAQAYGSTAFAFLRAMGPQGLASLGAVTNTAANGQTQTTNPLAQNNLRSLDIWLPDPKAQNGFSRASNQDFGISNGVPTSEQVTFDLLKQAKDTKGAATAIDEQARAIQLSVPVMIDDQVVAVIMGTLAADGEFEFFAQKKAQAARDGMLLAVLVCGLVAMLGTVLSFILSRSITAPVKALTEVAEKVSMGDLDVSVERRSNDEIGDLADSFGRMVMSVRYYRMSQELDESEIVA